MKQHRKIIPIDCKNGNYTVTCFLGNFHISSVKVRNKNMFKLHAFSKSSWAQALVRKYNSKLEREEILYKSLVEVTTAIEKACTTYYNSPEVIVFFEGK